MSTAASIRTSRKGGITPFPTGRLPSMDPRNEDYKLEDVQPRMALLAEPEPQKVTLDLRGRWSQGSYPACVGFTGNLHLRCKPGLWIRVKMDGLGLYQAAQMYDIWPGEGYDGSSIEGLLKFLHHHQPGKDIKEWRWAHTVEATNRHIAQRIHSGVLYGTNWYDSMFTPTAEGIVKVGHGAPSGHAYYKLGYDLKRGLGLFQNHWQLPNGKWWGLNGRFWMAMEDEQRLLNEDGEAGVTIKYQKGE